MNTLGMTLLAGFIIVFIIILCCFIDPYFKKKRLEKERAELVKEIDKEVRKRDVDKN